MGKKSSEKISSIVVELRIGRKGLVAGPAKRIEYAITKTTTIKKKPGPKTSGIGLLAVCRELFPKIQRLATEKGLSDWAAIRQLVNEIPGYGTNENRARRVHRRYKAYKRYLESTKPK
jgi:hypothetical protein